MSNYTINDSIFKLLFGAVKKEINRRRRRRALRRLNRAFKYANRLSNNPNDNFNHCMEINGVLYMCAFQKSAKAVFGEILYEMELKRNENED